jgi:uncharacterized protein DUF3854
MTQPSLGELYLLERGLTPETAMARFGIEIESPPSPAKFHERIGIECPEGVQCTLSIPVLSNAGTCVSWIVRLLPQPKNWPKFLSTKDSGGPPWMIPSLYDSGVGPLIITEGPIKAMVITLAGYDAIGLNGVWCAADPKKNGDAPLTLRPELRSLQLLGRKIYLSFDADQTNNPRVRHALIRLYLLLVSCGAEVYQLTTWPLEEAKGIDDYLVARGAERSAQTCAALIAAAKLFTETLSPVTPLDAQLVEKELPQIELGAIVRDQLTKELAKVLGVRTEVLRELV